ncbi:hypothetical protein ROTAS13_04666 [Roseomonas sp. TAS13]|uniref:hypothetical protein n=1 Tax=Roseomonas TaxID=125216 RepID=UPI00095BA465|nr:MULTISPECIES: hypothetical protein [Roseomonas]MCG7352623.1 hypothetical protein [Roseomonas mucosa]MCG7358261.1 hypothetical protein [Roseomonas mucosa]GAV36976.1 hypothetical protein ROTAS13_04666 [Roseomonas sp. TAS13]
MTDDLEPDSDRAALTAATSEEIAEVLSYALRYDERGKPRRGGGEFAAGIAAERLAEHLRRAGYVVMKARTARPHSTG